jgi:type I restriction enzyme S subunit
VGINPDWKTDLLGNVATLQRGFDLPHRLRKPGVYPIVTSSGLEASHCEPKIKGPGVVTGRYGTIGKVFFIQDSFWPLNTTLYVREFHGNDPLFVSYLLRTINFGEHSGKTGVPGVNRNDLHEIVIGVPPTRIEQETIAEALSDADAFVESLEQLLIKKRQIKQGAMQVLLTGKKLLPGYSDPWKSKQLGNSATLKARIGWQGLTTEEYLDTGDYYLVTGTEFKDGRIAWNECHYVDQSRYRQDKNIQLKVNDVLVTKDGTIGKVALITCLPKPATLNSGVFVIRPVEDAFDPAFFYYLLCSRVFADFLAQLSAGSTISHLYQKDFVFFSFSAPPTIDEQIAIATLLSDMDAEITALEAKFAKARQLRQGMMQELLTGRIRLV